MWLLGYSMKERLGVGRGVSLTGGKQWERCFLGLAAYWPCRVKPKLSFSCAGQYYGEHVTTELLQKTKTSDTMPNQSSLYCGQVDGGGRSFLLARLQTS